MNSVVKGVLIGISIFLFGAALGALAIVLWMFPRETRVVQVMCPIPLPAPNEGGKSTDFDTILKVPAYEFPVHEPDRQPYRRPMDL
jgi:hypothetical protein